MDVKERKIWSLRFKKNRLTYVAPCPSSLRYIFHRPRRTPTTRRLFHSSHAGIFKDALLAVMTNLIDEQLRYRFDWYDTMKFFIISFYFVFSLSLSLETVNVLYYYFLERSFEIFFLDHCYHDTVRSIIFVGKVGILFNRQIVLQYFSFSI